MTHPASRLCGLTPPYLHAATALGDVPMVQYLIASGVALELRDGLGRSALHVALDHKQFECGALLLRAGASREAMDASGKTVATRVLELMGQWPTPPSPPPVEVREERTGASAVITNLLKRKQKKAEASQDAKPKTPWLANRPVEWSDVEALGAFREDALDLKDALDARDREVRHG